MKDTTNQNLSHANAYQVGGDHYRDKAVQPWDAMTAWMSPEQFEGFLRGNAIKYLARYSDKKGIEDVRKAKHYIEKLIEHLGQNEKETTGARRGTFYGNSD